MWIPAEQNPIELSSQHNIDETNICGYKVSINDNIEFIEKAVRDLLTQDERWVYSQIQAVYQD